MGYLQTGPFLDHLAVIKICLFIRAGNVRTSDKGLSVPDKEDKPFDNAPQSQIPRQESSYSLERSFVLTKFVDVDIVDKN